MPKILLVGNDLRLLTTRAAVLAKTKASVIYCNALEAEQIFQSDSFDLIVLCHTLTGEQSAEVTGIANQKLPGTKILMITSSTSEDRPPKGVVFDGLVSSDPAGLVSRASRLLLQESILSV